MSKASVIRGRRKVMRGIGSGPKDPDRFIKALVQRLRKELGMPNGSIVTDTQTGSTKIVYRKLSKQKIRRAVEILREMRFMTSDGVHWIHGSTRLSDLVLAGGTISMVPVASPEEIANVNARLREAFDERREWSEFEFNPTKLPPSDMKKHYL